MEEIKNRLVEECDKVGFNLTFTEELNDFLSGGLLVNGEAYTFVFDAQFGSLMIEEKKGQPTYYFEEEKDSDKLIEHFVEHFKGFI